jgi:energy-coupling factor transport system substrate-specific component
MNEPGTASATPATAIPATGLPTAVSTGPGRTGGGRIGRRRIGGGRTGRDRTGRNVAIRIRARTMATLGMAAGLGVVAFFWPFLVAPGTFGATDTAPLIFGGLLLIVLAVLFAQIADGGIDSKALAMLGVLSAVNAALRPLSAGTAGIELVFFILVLAGRVFGPGFGFSLGCTSLFASALITGGVGPWMPYQMFGCAFVGLIAGLLPQRAFGRAIRGKAEVLMLAVYGAIAGYLFGFLLNLSFWPFSLDPGSSIAYLPGASFTTQWHRYLVYDATTSFGWDTGRAVTNFVCIAIAGPAVLATFRRAARRAAFEAPVAFAPPPTGPPPTGSPPTGS